MQLYDMHSHILPGFDDGAKTVEDSLALIDCLKKQGVSNICLTPHFYTHEMAPSDYIAKRNAVFESFLPHIPADVSIILGSEVYVTQFLFNGDDLSGLAYGKSGYILTEFPYSCDFGDKTMNMMDSLWSNHKLTPVLPHVERYEYLIDHPDEIESLKEYGVIIQTNISNYTDKASFFKKRKLLKMIDGGLIDILGSDTHSFTHSTPEVFSQACKTIEAKCGRHTLRNMMRNSKKIFNAATGYEEV